MKFIVPVTRIGYRQKEIEVEAPDMRAAKKIALNMAPDMEFPAEHESEYAATTPMDASSLQTV